MFDAGIKKLCRHNQYFGVRAAQRFVQAREGGILWHTQGSGKSLTMVWLAKWIRENVKEARVLIITDRKELDQQIETVFFGVSETIHRTKSGDGLISVLNETVPWLICSLVHKFGGKEDEDSKADVRGFVQEMKAARKAGFRAKGNVFVFVDECHRTQSGDLHEAMEALLPDAVFIGFTGTPLLLSISQKRGDVTRSGDHVRARLAPTSLGDQDRASAIGGERGVRRRCISIVAGAASDQVAAPSFARLRAPARFF